MKPHCDYYEYISQLQLASNLDLATNYLHTRSAAESTNKIADKLRCIQLKSELVQGDC